MYATSTVYGGPRDTSTRYTIPSSTTQDKMSASPNNTVEITIWPVVLDVLLLFTCELYRPTHDAGVVLMHADLQKSREMISLVLVSM